jgi:hypothetical protein
LKEFPRQYHLLQNYGPYQSYMGQLQSQGTSGFLDYAANMFIGKGPLFEHKPERGELSDVQDWLKDRERAEEVAKRQLEADKKASNERVSDIEGVRSGETESNEAALRLHTAIMSGRRSSLAAQLDLSPAGQAQLTLQDQLKLIGEGFAGKAAPLSESILSLQKEETKAPDQEQKDKIQAQIESHQVDLEKLQSDRLTQSVEALNRFNEAVREASDKIKEQFSSFASGLVSAAREGHAGTYTRNFMLGQFDKMVGNAASGVYQAGMLQFPGVASNPMLEHLFQGTMFGKDPMAHSSDALASMTDLNTKATADNTTALAGLIEALGYDPSSLGLSSASSIPLLSPLSSMGGAVGGLTTATGLILKGAGVSVPGINTSVAAGPPTLTNAVLASSGGGEQIGTIDQTIGTEGPGGTNFGWSTPYASLLSGGGGGPQQIGTLDTSIATSDSGNPVGNNSATQAPPTSALTTNIGMGVAAAGAGYGLYNAVTDFMKGGAQNDTAGIGKLAGVASTSLSLAGIAGPAAPILAGVGLAAGIVSALMGDPRANRQAHINSELFNNQYIAPMAYTRTMDISGNYASVDFRGNVRGSDLSSIPILQEPYPDPRHGVIVPGTVLSPFGGGGPSTTVPVGNIGAHTTDTGAAGAGGSAQSQGHTVNITNHVSAIDGDSVASFFQNHSQELGDGIVHALNSGGTDLANRLRTL